jgi:uncharacterized protein YegL
MINNSIWPHVYPPQPSSGSPVWPPQPSTAVTEALYRKKPYIPMGYNLTQAGKNGNLIVVILDESGSMNPIQSQTITAFNEFVDGQKNASAEAGEGFLTLIKFESPHIKTVYEKRPLAEVPYLNKETYVPGGGTNLNDAIGQAVSSINEILTPLSEEQRPGVIVMIMTDGQENASMNFSTHDIKNIVSAAEKADWTFTFLGANIDPFAVGVAYGMRENNTLAYSTSKMGDTMSIASAAINNMRFMKSSGSSTEQLYTSSFYSKEDRNKVK